MNSPLPTVSATIAVDEAAVLPHAGESETGQHAPILGPDGGSTVTPLGRLCCRRMTFSIVARSDDGESWGVAVASKFLAVGSAVPAAAAGVGAIATQADANLAYKYLGLAHLDDGATAQVALDRLVEEDEGREHRQVGIVDSDGNAATWTGSECFAWAGGTTGRSGERGGYAIQGNILTGPEVVEAMERAWHRRPRTSPLERRLLAALAAGDDAGGDSRGRQSAALLVVRDGAGYGGHDDVAVDLRVDDHADPVTELARLRRPQRALPDRVDRPRSRCRSTTR